MKLENLDQAIRDHLSETEEIEKELFRFQNLQAHQRKVYDILCAVRVLRNQGHLKAAQTLLDDNKLTLG